MNNLIKIKDVKINDTTISVNCIGNGKWNELVNLEQNFTADYYTNIESINDSIAVIPVLVNLLPISWIFNLDIEIDCLDKNFFESIPLIKEGYKKMYPELNILGNIKVNNIIENRSEYLTNAVMFSGGVDAFNTLINHINEKPAIITIWGADVKTNDYAGWDIVDKNNIEVSKKFDLKYYKVKSNFRSYINYENIMKNLNKICDFEWWHDFQHGIALLGLIAPLSKVIGIEKLYIASSFTADQIGNYKCASDPLIDNNVAYLDTKAYHDGYEFNRQQKIHNITTYKNNNVENINLRVCWKSSGGKNCCHCEKCYRTIMGILAEKKDPKDYGFNITEQQYKKMLKTVNRYAAYNFRYKYIQDAFKENYKNELPNEFKNFVTFNIKSKQSYFSKLLKSLKENVIKAIKNIIKLSIKLIKICYKQVIYSITKVKILFSLKKKNIFVIGIPHHGNLGDQAIAIAEMKFLQDNFKDYNIIEIESYFASNNIKFVKKIINSSPILVHGGGYLGTLWLNEEKMFRKVLMNFLDNEIITFPQTIYFDNDEEGREELLISKEIYQKHKKLKFFLREKYSYDFMKKNFPKCNIYLVPDIVLYLEEIDYNSKRNGVLFCMRSDKEKINDFKNEIEEFINTKNINVIDNTDTVINKKLYKFNRKKYVYNKVKQFSMYNIVITDRLHGMIFALLSKTPCLVFQNKSPKILGVYEWIKNIDYIKLCSKDDYKQNLEYLLNYTNTNNSSSLKEKFNDLVNEINNVLDN